MGLLDGAPIEFELVKDVPEGGVLFALPALLENGLLAHSREIFSMPEGFYPMESIFLLLALMTLDTARGFERVAGAVGALVTAAGIVAVFLPTGDVGNVWIFEMKMALGVGVPIGVGLWLYWRARRA